LGLDEKEDIQRDIAQWDPSQVTFVDFCNGDCGISNRDGDSSSFDSPLGSEGFGKRDPLDSFGSSDSFLDERPGGPDWAGGQIRNAAWVGAGAGLGVATGVVLAKGAAVLAATTAGPAILFGLAAYGVYKGIEAYDYDAISAWGSKFYGNELSVGELLTGGFIVGSTASGLGSVGASRAAPGLAQRAAQVHGTLDPIAQAQRTTAVLQTNGGRVIAGGARDLTPAQRALLGPGEIAAKLPGAHAEVTAIQAARGAGLTPQAMAVTRPICPQCATAIEASGGTVTSPTTAIWPR